MTRVGTAPIKCQGIKTKLVGFIASQIEWRGQGRWIEPFLGSGVVALNLQPQQALLADANPYIIGLYRAIQGGSITADQVRSHLQREGNLLNSSGDSYYYEVRSRFNAAVGEPEIGSQRLLDFVFLNRACFNGLMRFNRRGQFNVPFCRKPQRFAPAYITKIANQVDWARQRIPQDWEFVVQPWQQTLASAGAQDFVYLDPPYIGRSADYFNTWQAAEAEELADRTRSLPCGYALSMWLGNAHRQNPHIPQCWPHHDIRSYDHFYHLGSTEALRGQVQEALILPPPEVSISPPDRSRSEK